MSIRPFSLGAPFTLLLLTLVALPARSAVFTLYPVIDGTVTRGVRSTGQVTTTIDTAQEVLFSDRTTTVTQTFTKRLEMEFDIASLNPLLTIQRVQFQWTEALDELSSVVRSLLAGVGNGVIGPATFLETVIDLGPVGNGILDARKSVDIPLGPGVWSPSSFPLLSVSVLGNSPEDYNIYGRLASDPALRPALIITAVPEASSIMLLASILLIVGIASPTAWRRKKLAAELS
jgi:hypothetical protein